MLCLAFLMLWLWAYFLLDLQKKFFITSLPKNRRLLQQQEEWCDASLRERQQPSQQYFSRMVFSLPRQSIDSLLTAYLSSAIASHRNQQQQAVFISSKKNTPITCKSGKKWWYSPHTPYVCSCCRSPPPEFFSSHRCGKLLMEAALCSWQAMALSAFLLLWQRPPPAGEGQRWGN